MNVKVELAIIKFAETELVSAPGSRLSTIALQAAFSEMYPDLEVTKTALTRRINAEFNSSLIQSNGLTYIENIAFKKSHVDPVNVAIQSFADSCIKHATGATFSARFAWVKFCVADEYNAISTALNQTEFTKRLIAILNAETSRVGGSTVIKDFSMRR